MHEGRAIRAMFQSPTSATDDANVSMIWYTTSRILLCRLRRVFESLLIENSHRLLESTAKEQNRTRDDKDKSVVLESLLTLCISSMHLLVPNVHLRTNSQGFVGTYLLANLGTILMSKARDHVIVSNCCDYFASYIKSKWHNGEGDFLCKLNNGRTLNLLFSYFA
jgi:hypothetical protein